MACPAEPYQRHRRPSAGLLDLDYPFHDKAVTVTTCGGICYNRKNLSSSLPTVGNKQVEDHIWTG